MSPTLLTLQFSQVLVHERQARAEAESLARRLSTVRRLRRRVETADRRARLVRLALQQT